MDTFVSLEDLGGVLEFAGPDAVRFLNGQVTQDVRKAVGCVLPACVTDAKGKLQFRVWIAGDDEGKVLVFCQKEMLEDLEARLTRYLIADDVEVRDVSGEVSMDGFDFPGLGMSEEDRVEAGLPKWGLELKEGMLPPEAGLDVTDISYNKGCYIGQEVISRIKSAGKVNRSLVKFGFLGDVEPGALVNNEGKVCGEVTSVSGLMGVGYLKRREEGARFKFEDSADVAFLR
ncbi:MAG: YgfZ/GcvT domain-containing protein [Luteolibacter sp.]